MSGHQESIYKKFCVECSLRYGVEMSTVLKTDKAKIDAFEVWVLRIPQTEKINNDEKNGYSEINVEYVEIEECGSDI